VRNLTKLRGEPKILRPSGTGCMLRLDGDLESCLLLIDHHGRKSPAASPEASRRYGTR
jgi:hypothetical protein